MQLPFTAQQFINVFESYNAEIGMLPALAYVLGAGAVFFTFKKTAWSSRAITLVLASFWAFTGIAYHLMSFSAINPAARFFGFAFVLQALLLAWSGLRSRMVFAYRGDLTSKVGLTIIAWAMVGYPLVGGLLGHGYPSGPVFALTPCPLLLFTLGLFLLTERVPRYLIQIPIIWAIVGTTAAFSLGIREDLTLALSAATFIASTAKSALARRAAPRRSPARATSVRRSTRPALGRRTDGSPLAARRVR
ncbi:MAG: DUF6064 family protein [Coriobacteriia bacterium]